MVTLNIIKLFFSLLTISLLIFGSLVNLLEQYLPVYIVRTFRYGKYAYKGSVKCFIDPIEVPKSWFKHFYIFSSILTTIALGFVVGSYVLNVPVPVWLRFVLDTLSGSNFKTKVSSTATLLALILVTIQCYRRLYDTHYVSVFGAKSRMNLSHYLIGFIHYIGVVLAILMEAPNFSLSSNKIYYCRWYDISQLDIAASILFLWACTQQYKATVILANLRKNTKGKIVSNEHYMPEGKLFKYVSSPHLLTEILMYFSLTIILWQNTTWKYIFAWVLSNQVETALLSHWWYKETFPKYPKERKALIPFIF